MKLIQDLSEMEISKKDKILAVMPHPDDEAVFISGLLQKLVKNNISIRVIVFTQGEKSTNRFGISSKSTDLAETRKYEQIRSFKILKIQNYNILNLGDGLLDSKKKFILNIIKKEIEQFNPSIILTLEPDGIYGHPDHISLSNFASQFQSKTIKILYTTVTPNYKFPKARKMAKKTIIKPIYPQYYFYLSLMEFINKFRSLKSHYSQFGFLLIPSKALFHFIRNKVLFNEFYTFRV